MGAKTLVLWILSHYILLGDIINEPFSVPHKDLQIWFKFHMKNERVVLQHRFSFVQQSQSHIQCVLNSSSE